jgi:hypothetical protein
LVPYHLDAAGWVMLPLAPHQRAASVNNQPSDQLPLLDGIDPTHVQAGRRLETRQVRAALQLILAFEQSPMAGVVDLKRIDVSSPDTLLVTTGQGSEVTFGLADLEQQILRWREIVDMGQRLSKTIATLDLAVTNHIPARVLEASASPSDPPKPLKPTRTRKKHV